MTDHKVLELSIEERGAYFWLLCMAWISTDCTITSNKGRLKALLEGISDESLARVLEFWKQKGDRLYNSRLRDEWQKAKHIHEVRTNAGAKAKQTASKCLAHDPANADHTTDSRLQTPDSQTSESRLQTSDSLVASQAKRPDYELFKQTYNAQASVKGWHVCKEMSAKRKEIIQAWCKERPGFLEDFCKVIEWNDDPHWRGENDRGWQVNIDFVLRRPSRKYPVGVVPKLLEAMESPQAPKGSARTRGNVEAITSAMEKAT